MYFFILKKTLINKVKNIPRFNLGINLGINNLGINHLSLKDCVNNKLAKSEGGV